MRIYFSFEKLKFMLLLLFIVKYHFIKIHQILVLLIINFINMKFLNLNINVFKFTIICFIQEYNNTKSFHFSL